MHGLLAHAVTLLSSLEDKQETNHSCLKINICHSHAATFCLKQ